jgi:hypothetical protein
MKFNLKMIAVAVAMVSAAGAANAALATGNNGSLAIAAFNVVTNDWYIRDTGYLLNSFLPNGVTTLSGDGAVTGDKTPAAGLTLNSSTTSGFATDATWSTFMGGQTSSDIRWFVSAVDSSGTATASNVKRFITSSANADESATNGNLDGYISSANAGGLGTVYGSGSNGATSSWAAAATSAAPSAWSTNFGLGVDGLASLGDSVGLFYFARSTGTGSTTSAATKTQFGNATGYATVSLGADGNFSFNVPAASAVPVPAAAWLFGSGLLAMGGVIRRRKAAAQG